MATYYYGKNAQGMPVYESSTPTGTVNPSQAINSTTLGTQTQIQLPPPPQPTNLTPHVAGGAALITANSSAISQPPVGWDAQTYANFKAANPGLEPTPTDTQRMMQNTQQDSMSEIFNRYFPQIPESGANQYQTLYNQSNIGALQEQKNQDTQARLAAQAKLSSINARLAGLTAQGQVMNLNQAGRQAPLFEISGQQAENNRQIAIQALPLQAEAMAAQAEVAAAQGNEQLSTSILQQAQNHLDTLFGIYQTDASNQYKYQMDAFNTIYDYADKQQQRLIDSQKSTITSNNTQYNAFVNDIRTMSATAIQNGQSGVASQLTNLISTLNPNSSSFATDFQAANAQLATLQARIPQQKDLQFVSGTANQPAGYFDKTNGTFTPFASGNGGPIPDTGQSQYQTETAQRVITSTNQLLTIANQNPGIFGRTAALPIPDFMRSNDFRNFKAQLDTLKSNVAFNALNAMREASKTGGALGQISDREETLLSNTLGSLDMAQTPEQIKNQLTQINASVTRWLNAVQTYGNGTKTGTFVTAPDGTIIQLTD